MAASKSDREIKTAVEPLHRQVRTGGNPESTEGQTIAWQFHRLDREHALWGWSKLNAKQWRLVLHELVALEGLTWQSLKEQSGGRRHGTNHHACEIDSFCRDAKQRLADLHLDDYDTLFSLRLQNTLRLYGIRDGRVLRLLWHDPHHGGANGAYPLARK